MLEQQIHQGAISILGGGVNGTPAELLAGVYRGSAIEQEAGGFQVAG
jgi:hypothetical protein